MLLRWCHGHRPQFLLVPLRDRKGEREENERRRTMVKGEPIVSIATNEREMEMKKQVTTQWRKPCSLFHSSKEMRMKTKSNDLPFIHRPFEGRFNPYWPTA